MNKIKDMGTETGSSGASKELLIRTMRPGDIGAAMRLKQAAGWNQTYSDWKRFLLLAPAGSHVAVNDGRVVGTVTTCVFRTVAWIGMMLVDPAHRRQGIATRLMRHALDKLDRAGCTSVSLDATEMGAGLYRRLGFGEQQEIVRLGGQPRRSLRGYACAQVRAFQWEAWPLLLQLDQAAAGSNRTKLLKTLLVERSGSARIYSQDGCLLGFVFDRPGSSAKFVGPLVALSPEAGNALLTDALGRAWHVPVVIDIPAANEDALAVAGDAGLTAQRRFLRMVRGQPCSPVSPALWASSGPEKG